MPTPHSSPHLSPAEHGAAPPPPLTPPSQATAPNPATVHSPAIQPAGVPLTSLLTPTAQHSSDDTHQHTLSHHRILPPPSLNLAFSRSSSFSDDSSSSSRKTSHSHAAASDHANDHDLPQLSEHHRHERPATVLATLFQQWLPSLLSTRPIRHTFTRNLDNALRGVASFAVAAVLACQPFPVGLLAVPYLFLVFAATTIRPTAGGTLAGIDVQFKGVLAAAVVDVVITGAQIGRLSQTNRIVVVEVVLFVTSIPLAYYFRPPLARRFALAIHALIMVEIALGVNQVVLPLQTLLCAVLAYGVAFVLITLPFPRLAADELLDRYQQSLLSLSGVFREIVRCYLSTEPIAPQVLNTALSSQLDAVFKSLSVMRRLQGEAAMECSLFPLCFPSCVTVGNPVIADPDRIEQLYWIVTNLLSTLSTLHYSSYHAAFVHYLSDAFRRLSREQAAYLSMLGSPDSCDVTAERVEQCMQRLDAAMAGAWSAYSRARRKLYGYAAAEQAREGAEQRKRRNSLWKGHSRVHSDNGRTSAFEPDGDESKEDAQLLTKTEKQAVDAAGVASDGSILLHGTQEVFTRSSFFYYVSRFHHCTHLLPLDHDVLAVPPTTTHSAASLTSAAAPSPSARSVWPRKRFATRRLLARHLRDPLAWSCLGFHPVRDAAYLVRTLHAFVRRPAVDWAWLQSSVIISFIVCVASLIAVIPQLSSRSVFPNAYWAPFTAAILASDTQGSMIQRAFHRLFGTLLGGLVGYLILLCFPDNWYGSLPLLGLWCFFMQFVSNSSYAYLGMLAAFTPIVTVFGYSEQPGGPDDLSVERYSLARMEEIAIGIGIAVLLSSVLWPVSSIRLLRSEMMVSVQSFKAALGHTSEIYDRLVRDDDAQPDTKPDEEEHKQASDEAAARATSKADGANAAKDVEIEIATLSHDEAPTEVTAGQSETGAERKPTAMASPSQTAAASETNESKSQPSSLHHSSPLLYDRIALRLTAFVSFVCVVLRDCASSAGCSAVLLRQRADVPRASDSLPGRSDHGA